MRRSRKRYSATRDMARQERKCGGVSDQSKAGGHFAQHLRGGLAKCRVVHRLVGDDEAHFGACRSCVWRGLTRARDRLLVELARIELATSAVRLQRSPS